MELIEGVAPPALAHDSGSNADCPFCPVEKGKCYTTYKGAANDSGILEDIMVDPEQLDSKQSGAWPHDGKKHASRAAIQSKHSHPEYGDYEFQAHHLISGKQALQDHVFEKWIDASQSQIEEDTGYTINGSLNGIWAPSWPKSFRGGAHAGEWTTGSIDRQEIANYVMAAEGCQFHLGAHNIGDPQDSGAVKHQRYDKWLKKMLTKMNKRMWGWSNKCPLCCEDGERKEPPFQPNENANRYLNNLSAAAEGQLTGPRQSWFIFISRLALEYHRPVCGHGLPSGQVLSG
ncbi:MAG: AHH domain-containing protein [Planctomycetes bacterium]|nr:AHH domain-containing protein [Planctomycetota bacterium]